MSFLHSTSVRMRYAVHDQSIVPQWKLLYYDSQTLMDIIELMEKVAFLQNKLRKYISQPYKEQNQLYLKLYKVLNDLMDQLNQNFTKYHFCQKQVIFVFVQMKYLQLSQKFKKYRIICSTSNQQIATQIYPYFKVKFKKDNKTLIQVLLAISRPQQEQLSQNILIIWQNLYIECLLLKKLILFNQKEEKIILNLHSFVVDKYFQFQRPRQFISRQKFKKLLNNLQDQIETYINHKNLYSIQEDNHQNKFKQLSKSIQYSKLNQNYVKSFNIGLWFFGFWCGLIIFSIGLLITILHITNISLDNNTQFQDHFPVWRGLSYFLFYFWTLGLTLGILEIKQINYKLIFSLDQSFVPTSFYTLIIAAAFSTIFMMFFVGYVLSIRYQALQYLPGVLWLIMFLILFNPLPILNRSLRIYWIKMLFLMIISPFNWKSKIDFKINWLTQQFVSFKQPFHDLVYTIIYYLIDSHASYSGSIVIGEIITMIVLLWRILQGFKTGYDNGAYFSDDQVLLRAAIKCSLGILTILFSLVYITYLTPTYLIIWILIAFITTFYTYHFDLKYDWGLLDQNSQQPLLTNLITFKPRFYYFIMIINLILRLSWVLNISTGIVQKFGIKPYITIMIFAYLEIIRRSIWNLLKIQREHLRSCQKYQAIVNYQIIQKTVQQNIFKRSLQKYVNNLECLYVPIKNQVLTQIKKDLISQISKKPYYKIIDQTQMSKAIIQYLLNIDSHLIKQRKLQQFQLLNFKVEQTKKNQKQFKQYIKNKKNVIQDLENLIQRAELNE